ncbi:hypothetical protein N7462_007868 [Penicillium macrosclerotiorum]|uniref:uncharacterized protein n=1 Tax=Penicillium macrosclerotiorum TaxID=303699 RepID=UPI0025493860|nr:uncharacterized protein N7462_007868 [Penicillium macrosclerotiorum]KAJ5679624.1 hypothetical protein N7462_007868 [Penicillium macrosclerotiorum]
MSDSGDEADSRTASVGVQRSGRRTPSAQPAHDKGNSRPVKKRRRGNSRADREVSDFVPRGASFSANGAALNTLGQDSLEDLDETSSSGSSSNSDSDSDDSDAHDEPAPANPHVGSTAPAISWNQTRKNVVRTSLGKRKAETVAPVEARDQPKVAELKANGIVANGNAAKKFKTVNGTYWRSRSASVSSEGTDEDVEEGEVDSRSDSEDSDSLGSEADDSILLNIGTKTEDGVDDYDPESVFLDGKQINGHTDGQPHDNAAPLLNSGATTTETKEDAFRNFSQKYPTAPVTLMDLMKEDMDIQAKFVYWDRDVNDIDLQLPVGCTECLRQGHMAEVCPTKECVHCEAWNKHSSICCPSWRRCQRCRERGHDESQCSSPLKSSPAEVPCDLCGSSAHVESQCDHQWKFPMREPTTQAISVSISCAHCTSTKHLIGDCPSLRQPLKSSSFTLKDIDPSTITNLNIANGPPKGPSAPNLPPKSSRGRGRRGAPVQVSSSESDDAMSRRAHGGRRPPRRMVEDAGPFALVAALSLCLNPPISPEATPHPNRVVHHQEAAVVVEGEGLVVGAGVEESLGEDDEQSHIYEIQFTCTFIFIVCDWESLEVWVDVFSIGRTGFFLYKCLPNLSNTNHVLTDQSGINITSLDLEW